MKSTGSRKKARRSPSASASSGVRGHLESLLTEKRKLTVVIAVVLLAGAGGYFAWNALANRGVDYEAQLKVSPAYSWYQRGVAAAVAGRSQEAVQSLERALEMDPTNALIYNALATQHLRDQDPYKALRTCERGIYEAPNSPDLYYTLGLIKYQIGKYDEVVPALDRSVELRSDYPEAFLWRGKAKMLLASMAASGAGFEPTLLASAIEDLREAADLAPDVPEYHSTLAEALFQRRELDEARAEIQRAVDLDPKSAPYLRSLGKVCDQLGDLDCAAAAYQRAVELDPASAEAYFGLGMVQFEREQDAEAVVSFQTAIERNQFHTEAHEKLGEVLTRMGRIDEAQKAIEIAADSREREKTIQNLRRASAADPRNAQLANNLGIELARQGAYDEALMAFQRALAADPRFIDAQYQLGGVHFAKMRFSRDSILKALEAFDRVDKQQPGYRWTNFYLSKLNERLGRQKEARTRMEQFEKQKAEGTLSDS